MSVIEQLLEREQQKAVEAAETAIACCKGELANLQAQLALATAGQPYRRPEVFGTGQLAGDFAKYGAEIAAGFDAVETVASLKNALAE